MPTPDEVREAFAHPVLPEGPCCAKRLAAAQRAGRPPRTIVYVNGILTGLHNHCCSLRKLASTTCARVVGVFNATEGGHGVEDIWQARGDIAVARAVAAGRDRDDDEGRNPARDAVRAVVVEKGREGEPLEIWAHSQGGATTAGALFRARQDLANLGVPHPLEDVTVNSFGSAAALWPDGPAYTHYIHEADPVAAGLTGSDLGNFGKRTGLGDAGLGPGPFGERVAGKGATIVYADGPVATDERNAASYQMVEHRLPDPSWRTRAVPAENTDLRRMGDNIQYHLFDSSYLPLYRERAAAQGRDDNCSPPTYCDPDPCAPPKQQQAAVGSAAGRTAPPAGVGR